MINTTRCAICKKPRKTVYWHQNENNDIWCWCCSCDRAYSLYEYCKVGNISIKELMQSDFTFESGNPEEVQKIEWPAPIRSISNPIAKPAHDFLKERGLTLEGNLYYDIEYNGILFPLYFSGYFCGGQIRLIEPWKIKDNEKEVKMITIPGTKSSLLFYNWDQSFFHLPYRGIIITEGALDCLSIEQALNSKYGVSKNPWKVIATNGAGASDHHIKTIKELKDKGLTVVLASDSDEAGLKMLVKFKQANAITHLASTCEFKIDWNDKLRELGHDEFAKYFIKQIAKV